MRVGLMDAAVGASRVMSKWSKGELHGVFRMPNNEEKEA